LSEAAAHLDAFSRSFLRDVQVSHVQLAETWS